VLDYGKGIATPDDAKRAFAGEVPSGEHCTGRFLSGHMEPRESGGGLALVESRSHRSLFHLIASGAFR
jgi:hypothetical protein